VSFTIDDFQDLIRLLDQHPEWRAELRRHVLSDELLELPTLVRQLAEAQARTDARVDTLTARVDTLAEQLATLTARVDALTEQMAVLTARVDALTEQVAVLTARVDALTEQMAVLTARVDALTEQVAGMNIRLGSLTGEALERRYRDRAPAYFSDIVGRIRVLDSAALASLLDPAVEEHLLAAPERRALLLADIVLTGRRNDDQQEVYLLVEVSAGIGPYDVQRAVERSALLAKLGRPVVPVVAGDYITPEAEELARKDGVWQVLDGRVVRPAAA
jgi:cell division protein FtsB